MPLRLLERSMSANSSSRADVTQQQRKEQRSKLVSNHFFNATRHPLENSSTERRGQSMAKASVHYHFDSSTFTHRWNDHP